MKLKYNQDGVTETIPLSTRKKQGKRLAIHNNGQNFYAQVVSTDDPKASNLPVGINGEIFAVQAQEPPEVISVNVAPSSVSVMQGQSATATVSAIGNDAITGLSYGLSGAPTWITISDDVILIQPSDSDLGFANVQVYAQDTGSDAMSAAILRAEAKLRPIIESFSVIPPAVTVQQGQSAIAGISAVANAAVTGLSYSLNGASSWVNLNDDYIYVTPTDNDLGTNVLDVFAYDTNSSASAATQFTATAALRPIISSVSVNPPTVSAAQGESTTATISAVANEAVTGLSYSLEGQPSWMNLSGSVILMTPSDNDLGSNTVDVIAYDTNSSASAATVFYAEAMRVPKITDIFLSTDKATVNNKFTATLTYEGNDLVKDVTYSLSPESQGSLNGAVLSYTPGEAGIIPFTITATNAQGQTLITKTLTVSAKNSMSVNAYNNTLRLPDTYTDIYTLNSRYDFNCGAPFTGVTITGSGTIDDQPSISSYTLYPENGTGFFTVTTTFNYHSTPDYSKTDYYRITIHAGNDDTWDGYTFIKTTGFKYVYAKPEKTLLEAK